MAIDYSQLTHAKPVARRKVKAQRDRAARAVVATVRPKCVRRDGYCRVEHCLPGTTCSGPSEWAHLHSHRRSKTSKQPAEVRHTTAGSFILCRGHHAMYDNKRQPRLYAEPLSPRGADGRMRFCLGMPFSVASSSMIYTEP